LRLHLQSESDIKIVADAFDGEEAVKMAAEHKPDLIIMDITMPKLNGLEATRRIKERNPDIEILVLTVHDDSEHILKILEAGAAGYITKTILGEKLVRAVRSIIDGDSILSDNIMDKLLKHALRYPAEESNPDLEQRLSIRELEYLNWQPEV
jgi:DNA-binding NarL/FixJ family response regulator